MEERVRRKSEANVTESEGSIRERQEVTILRLWIIIKAVYDCRLSNKIQQNKKIKESSHEDSTIMHNRDIHLIISNDRLI